MKKTKLLAVLAAIVGFSLCFAGCSGGGDDDNGGNTDIVLPPSGGDDTDPNPVTPPAGDDTAPDTQPEGDTPPIDLSSAIYLFYSANIASILSL